MIVLGPAVRIAGKHWNQITSPPAAAQPNYAQRFHGPGGAELTMLIGWYMGVTAP
jgi:hypothetical protein